MSFTALKTPPPSLPILSFRKTVKLEGKISEEHMESFSQDSVPIKTSGSSVLMNDARSDVFPCMLLQLMTANLMPACVLLIFGDFVVSLSRFR